MRIDHDIFHTPNQVQLTLTDQPTPTSYAFYPEGRELGETMPMWRVQTEGYLTHEGQLMGIVSRDAGFLDSPDVEWISSGVNTKGPSAVALGRHGNFFHWGFAASPTYMTDEAKDVFVNALHYIARFAGQTPIARKMPGTMMRSAVDDVIDGLSKEGYARTVAMYQEFQEDDRQRKAAIQARLDAGEEVSDFDRQVFGSREPQIPDRLDRARRLISPEVIEELGEDPEESIAYLRENRPFMVPSGWYSLIVDEELKSLGIANDDVALLDRLVVLLASGQDDDRARGLLERYTAESFATAREWAEWLETNRERLFFTEAGGFKWLVNTIGSPKEATPASKFETPRAAGSTGEVEVQATARSPLASGLGTESLGDGRFALTLHVDILEGWHAYDVVPENSPYAPLQIELELPEGVRLVGDWQRPAAHASVEDPELTTFEGRLTFRCEIAVSAGSEVACKVRYQICDATMCRPPATITHRVALEL